MRGLVMNAADSIERQNEKLLKITEVLMRRVEQVTNDGGAAYEHFQRAVMLEDQVRTRTRELETALDLLNQSNAQLSGAIRSAEAARNTLTDAIETVREGFGLFDEDDLLVLCNSRFAMFMPDIREHLRTGLSFEDYIDRASRSRFLNLPAGQTPRQWADRRRARHRDDHIVFNVSITGDRWVQISEHRTEAGQTVVLQTDVTDIMRIERRERSRILDNQSRLIGATLEHLDQGVCIFDNAGVLMGWNNRAAELLGMPLAALRLGTPLSSLLEQAAHFDLRPAGGPTIADWIAIEGARPPLAYEMTHPPGIVLKVDAREMPDRGFVVSFSDMTQERRAAAELRRAKETLERRVVERTLDLEDALTAAERANASKIRFVAAASHDLLQPLSAAKLFVSSLAEAPDGDTARIAAKTQNALESVESMIESLLAISKLETVETFEVGPVDLTRLLAQLRAEFAPAAAAKGLDLRVVGSSAWVESDRTYFRRIVQNLIGNAIRYTPSGKVLVGVRHRGGTVRIEVHDTGPGIPEESQEEIFKEFHRLDARASASEGLGLGLAIVDRACALLGHPLGLRSEVGRGSTFSVTAPLAVPPFVMRQTQAISHVADTGRLVLLIEDDDELREALELALGRRAHHVIDAPGIEAALALVADLDLLPDVCLVDYQLGDGTTAFDGLDRLRAGLPGVPLCMLTANRAPQVAERCAKEGMELIQKPVDLDTLDRALKRLAVGG
ncbi:response regulator [Silicimonas algicola]|uniref:histidine kinase n=1 Tax=Silicimonas algicola TaxID=1826607 RepID=A0A316GI07_9RHOB|nr:PAS-domain containing protein [Silicimonas algicola]AZQ66659.1 response regulator [Silicimonas algicola]PWK59010.1 signal transduction histidine kinase [Silicimonas algicola]